MDRIALIDNATLTSSQRLLGTLGLKASHDIDGDIAAFEGLLQAILFFDEICCIDDSKEDARNRRRKQFDFVTFLSEDDIGYTPLMQAARETTEDIRFRVAEGKIDTSDFRQFFDQLKMHIDFSFGIWPSSVHLLVNLVADVSNVSGDALYAMIAHQMWGDGREPSPILRSGAISPEKVSDETKVPWTPEFLKYERNISSYTTMAEQFEAALNWLAMKTVFYVKAAEVYGMDVVLHPIRHAFLAQYIQRACKIPTSTYDAVTHMLREGIEGTVREITKATDPILSELKLPMWCAYLATVTKDPAEFTNRCQHLREEALFVEARSHLSELGQLAEGKDIGEYRTSVNRLNRSLADVSNRLLSKYGVSTPQGIAIAPVASIALKAAGHPLPVVLPKIPVPRSLIGSSDSHGFRGIFRSVVSDLVSIERLGKLHEIVTARVRFGSMRKGGLRA